MHNTTLSSICHDGHVSIGCLTVHSAGEELYYRLRYFCNCLQRDCKFRTDIKLIIRIYQAMMAIYVQMILHLVSCVNYCLFWISIRLCRSGSHGMHYVAWISFQFRDLPGLASQVLGLKACTTKASRFLLKPEWKLHFYTFLVSSFCK